VIPLSPIKSCSLFCLRRRVPGSAVYNSAHTLRLPFFAFFSIVLRRLDLKSASHVDFYRSPIMALFPIPKSFEMDVSVIALSTLCPFPCKIPFFSVSSISLFRYRFSADVSISPNPTAPVTTTSHTLLSFTCLLHLLALCCVLYIFF